MLRIEYLSELHARHREDLNARVAEFSIAGKPFPSNSNPAIMGVVNLSPDSWYRESVCLTTESAVRRARVLHEQGASIIDLGAESTLAHAERVGPNTQAVRLLPVLRELSSAGILTSIETYQADVARACLSAGANVLNLTGIAEPDLFRIAADHNAAIILCFVQGKNVREVRDLELGEDPIGTLRAFFEEQIEKATQAGVTRIFLDPGLGFYYRNLQDSKKRVQHQMNTFLNTFRLRSLGWPICHALPHAFETFGSDVRCAEPFFTVLAALGRTDLFRTHEVSRVRAVLDTLELF